MMPSIFAPNLTLTSSATWLFLNIGLRHESGQYRLALLFRIVAALDTKPRLEQLVDLPDRNVRRRVLLPHAPEGFELLERHGFPDVVPGPARGHHHEGGQFVEVWGLAAPVASPGDCAFILVCAATTSAAAIIS